MKYSEFKDKFAVAPDSGAYLLKTDGLSNRFDNRDDSNQMLKSARNMEKTLNFTMIRREYHEDAMPEGEYSRMIDSCKVLKV